MDGTVLGIFEWLEVMADLSNIENCHWAKPSKGSKKVLWKLLDTKTSTTYFHRKRSEEYEFIITAYQLNGLQSTIGYVLITKFWRVNVGNLYIYIFFLGDKWYNQAKNCRKRAILRCYSPKRFVGVASWLWSFSWSSLGSYTFLKLCCVYITKKFFKFIIQFSFSSCIFAGMVALNVT